MIERAGAAHAVAMAALHASAFPPGARWDEAAFAAQLRLPGVFGLIDAAGGFVLVRAAGGEAEVLTLAVAPETRRKGLGRALLAAAMARAAEAGARRMVLEVSEWNEAGRALYEGAGFSEVGRRRRYYPDGSDALVLAADLGEGACYR
jgi:ribosomal-protein-alanine N-acetyltransferase